MPVLLVLKSEVPLLVLVDNIFCDHAGYHSEGLHLSEYGLCIRLRDNARYILVDMPYVNAPDTMHPTKCVIPSA